MFSNNNCNNDGNKNNKIILYIREVTDKTVEMFFYKKYKFKEDISDSGDLFWRARGRQEGCEIGTPERITKRFHERKYSFLKFIGTVLRIIIF